MKIQSDQVKELRNQTGAGILACKQALQKSGGDMEKAIDILRAEGTAKIAKREGKEAREGLLRLKILPDAKKAALLELNCETDFVARLPEFVALADALIDEVLEKGSEVLESEAVKERVTEVSAKIGEKFAVRRALLWEKDDFIGGYLHHNNRLAVLVELTVSNQAVAREVAMQIAAVNPPYLTEADVPAEMKEREVEIFRQQVADKPEAIQEKIVIGKWKKRLTELCLLDQPFVQNDKISVRKYLEQQGETDGKPIEIKAYARWRLGEE